MLYITTSSLFRVYSDFSALLLSAADADHERQKIRMNPMPTPVPVARPGMLRPFMPHPMMMYNSMLMHHNLYGGGGRAAMPQPRMFFAPQPQPPVPIRVPMAMMRSRNFKTSTSRGNINSLVGAKSFSVTGELEPSSIPTAATTTNYDAATRGGNYRNSKLAHDWNDFYH